MSRSHQGHFKVKFAKNIEITHFLSISSSLDMIILLILWRAFSFQKNPLRMTALHRPRYYSTQSKQTFISTRLFI